LILSGEQVEGRNGFGALTAKFKASGPRVLYHGALAASAATLAGHFPWFFTHNLLNEHLPEVCAPACVAPTCLLLMAFTADGMAGEMHVHFDATDDNIGV